VKRRRERRKSEEELEEPLALPGPAHVQA